MSERATFRLVDATARSRALDAVQRAEEGAVVTVGPPTRSADQNALLHAALTDISKQVEWHGRKLSVVIWKRLCTASWLREIGEQPMLVPALDGNGFDVIFEKTSQMNIKQLLSLLDWSLAFGAQNGVTFRDPAPARMER